MLHMNPGPVGVLFGLLSSTPFVHCHVSLCGISDEILIAVKSSPCICTKITGKALLILDSHSMIQERESNKTWMVQNDKHEDR